ncbi:3'(2'),5'-bisphosphate nucleotidase 1-like isoform X2 [Adelges cooleyi]|uniref:3'(2'),5'-bisphosphate nucleotidase 1-like isoform X2 n=1 Tax=Adelges cooleyi TaxID=133065 RepID=UPI0021803391|nr:3'(2'),5'-bisphosphate nucleotidase 1-like isoform X2 [Adelges cooleyi]
MYFKYTILLCLFYFYVIKIICTESTSKLQQLEGEMSTEEEILDTPQSMPKTVVAPEQKPLMIQLLALSVAMARRAGEIIRDITLNGKMQVVYKKENDPQTIADRSAQRSILASIKRHFPNINVAAEETDEESLDTNVPDEWLVTELDSTIMELECPQELRNITEEQVTFWIDPLDGTSGYTHDHVTVLIGICVDEEAIAGVIHQPYHIERRTLWGLVGYGFGGFELQEPPTKTVYVTTSSVYSTELATFLDSLEKPCVIENAIGVGYKVVYILDGKAIAYVHPTSISNRWDTAAPEAVLRAAGGQLTDRYGDKYCYSYNNKIDPLNKHGIIATGPKLNHGEFMEQIKAINSKQMASQKIIEGELSSEEEISD